MKLLSVANHHHLILFRPNKVHRPSRKQDPAAGSVILSRPIYPCSLTPFPRRGNRMIQKRPSSALETATAHSTTPRYAIDMRFFRQDRPYRSTRRHPYRWEPTICPRHPRYQPLTDPLIFDHLERRSRTSNLTHPPTQHTRDLLEETLMNHHHHAPSLPHGHAFDLQRRQAPSNAPKARLTIIRILLSARCIARGGNRRAPYAP